MEIIELINSSKLTFLYNEVTNKVNGSSVKLEVVNSFSGSVDRLAECEHKYNKAIIRIQRSDVEPLNPNLEMYIAHELLHIKRKREGIPRILIIPGISDELSIVAGGEIDNFVEHSIINPELVARGFQLDEYIKGRVEGILTNSNDPTTPIEHISKAFNIADFLVSFPDCFFEDRIKKAFPNTWETVEKLINILKKADIHTPHGTRRCYISIIKLVDSLTKITPALIDRLGIDLVLSKSQENLTANSLFSFRIMPRGFLGAKSELVQLLFQTSQVSTPVFFAHFGPKTTINKLIQELNANLAQHSARDFLKIYGVSYIVRL